MRELYAITSMFLNFEADMPTFTEPLRLPPSKKPTGALKQRRAARKRKNKQRRKGI